MKATIGLNLVLILGMLAAGCGSTSTASPVTEDEARAMAENMLAAYNTGEYGAWSRDWSQVMKDAIGEDAFLAFRDQTMATAGSFVSIGSIQSRPGNNPGVTRWEFETEFENGPMDFMIAFEEGSKLIEGVDLRPGS